MRKARHGLKNKAKVSKETCRKKKARRSDKLKTREKHYHPGQSMETSHSRARYSKEMDRVLF